MDELRYPPDSLESRDERLAREVTAGSSEAFSTLYERYHELLYRYCRSILLHEADAHDAVQSTFTRVLEALRRDQRDAPLRPWLFRIAHNESISMLRRRKAARELYSDLSPLSVAVEDRVGDREQVGLLVDDLQKLPPRQRGAIVMRELGGLSHEEIGAALGLSLSGARQAIFEARGALNEFAEGRAMACEDVRRELSEGDRRVMRRRPIRAHLRDCAACAAFAAGLPARRAGLRALGAPFAAGPTTLFARLLGPGSSRVNDATSGGGGFLTNAANNLTGAALAAKPIAALAIGLTAAATTGTVIYGLSERTGGGPAGSTAGVMRTAPASAQASVAPVLGPGGRAWSRSHTPARGAAPNVRLVLAGSGRGASLVGPAGHSPTSSLKPTRGRSSHRESTSQPSTGPVASLVQNAGGAQGNGSSGQASGQSGASSGSGQSSGESGATGGGNGASGQPSGTTGGSGQAPANGVGNGNASGPPAHGGNGNGGQPPGQSVAKGGNGNAGQPPGLTGSHGDNGNAGQPPGLTGPHGGNGNAGQPPGLTGSHGGGGNAGKGSHGG